MITVGDEVSPVSMVLLLVVFLAAGLALSALLMVLPSASPGARGKTGAVEPSIES